MKIQSTRFWKVVALLLAITDVLIWFNVAQAATAYPFASLLQPNDIETKHIRAGNVTVGKMASSSVYRFGGLDIATTTNRAGITVAASSTFPLFYLEGGPSVTNGPLVIIQASSTEVVRVTNTGNVGIASSSPSVALSVGGAIMASSTITAPSLNVTGTTTMNGVNLLWPATAGTSGYTLSTDGVKQMSWVQSASNLQNASTTGKTITNSITETSLYIYSISGNTLSTGNVIHLRIYISDLDLNYSISGSSEDSTLKVYYGATAISTFTLTPCSEVNLCKNAAGFLDVYLVANGATNNQIARSTLQMPRDNIATTYGGFTISREVTGTAAIDSTVAQNLNVTWTGGSTNDAYSITTDFAIMELLK